MKKERWKDIPGFGGLYQASTRGRIRSIRNKKPHVMKFYFTGNNNSYYGVKLRKDNKRYKYRVSRLVASTFLGNVDGKEVNHLDFNRFNNHVSNLEICTKSENMQHALKHGRHGAAKLSPSMVMSIRKMYDNRTPQKVIANLLGVNCKTISRIVNAKSWSKV